MNFKRKKSGPELESVQKNVDGGLSAEEQFFGSMESPIGRVEVLATQWSIAGVRFAPGAGTLASSGESPALRQCLLELEEYFAGTRKVFTVPITPSGTAFERTVWMALQDVPFGETRSYRDIARGIDREKAVRAVGRANGLNPIWIIIPCHRIIGSDGSLTGYGGGIERKLWLLDHEARISGTRLL